MTLELDHTKGFKNDDYLIGTWNSQLLVKVPRPGNSKVIFAVYIEPIIAKLPSYFRTIPLMLNG